jgi:hypothetical protein
MAISLDTNTRLAIALTKQDAGNEVNDALNIALAQGAQDLVCMGAMIVATSVSQTVDFAALKVGDKVVVHAAGAADQASHWVTVATAGTLGEAAVIGSLYLVFRPFVAPAASTFQF